MIYGIRINNTDPKQTVCPWWHKIEWLKGKGSLEFTPGLNVLYGPNGSGKSTVLQTIAKLLCCFDGDRQLVGQYTTSDTMEWDGKERKLKLGVEPLHDGSPIIHFDPSQTVGLIGGAFDWDFGDMGLRNCLFKGSTGQTNIVRMDSALAAALKGKWPKVEWKGAKPEHLPQLAEFLKGDGTKVRPTLLMDEPSRSLDLRTEIRLMKILAKIATENNVQVIMATHSVFALHLDGANFIDTTRLYSEDARTNLELQVLRALRAKPERMEVLMGLLDEQEKAEKPKRKRSPRRKPK